MPLYEYHCESCGDFEAWGKISESGAAAQCEHCGEYGERVISAPSLAILGATQRSAHERNEKSAHEPRMTRKSSCGCNGAHTCATSGSKPAEKAKKNKANKFGLEMQTKKSARPWMLGH